MKAWIFGRYGGPEVLEWADLPDPVAGKGEIVVRVVAAALNPLDWKLRAGQYKVMTAEIIDAAEAHRIGLVSRVVTPDELIGVAQQLAAKIAAQPPLAVSHVKEGLRRAVGRSYTELSDVATFVGNGLARLFESEDHKEAVAAFMEKRPAVFTGR